MPNNVTVTPPPSSPATARGRPRSESVARLLARAKRRLTSRAVLVALHAVLLVEGCHTLVRIENSNRLFDAVIGATRQPEMTESELAVALMHRAHTMLWATKPVIAPKKPAGLHQRWQPLVPAALDPAWHFAAPVGGCGSFTVVFAKLLERAGIEFRLLQMNCNGRYPACHIMLEAALDGRWVSMDPMFALVFENPDGTLASYREVSEGWALYQHQVPASATEAPTTSEAYYDVEFYDYAGVRYTNWDKVPVLMPALKWVLDRLLGPAAAEQLSLRSYFYDAARNRLLALGAAYAAVLALTYARYRRRTAKNKELS